MWFIRAYEKDGDRLVREAVLSGVPIAQLRQLWSLPADDPMYDAYPITNTVAAKLSEHLGERLELDRFDYFLEYDAEPEDGNRCSGVN